MPSIDGRVTVSAVGGAGSGSFNAGCVAASERWIVVCDRDLPVFVMIDREQMELERVVSWPIRDSMRRRPVVTGAFVHGGDVWISSPAAGGMARWCSETGAVTIVELDAMPGPIARLGSDLVVFAWRDWLGDGEPDVSDDVVHPVEWCDGGVGGGALSGWSSFPLDGSKGGWAMVDVDHLQAGMDSAGGDDGVEEVDDDVVVEAIRPVWRLVDGVPARFDLGGDAGGGVTTTDGALLAAVRRPDHPLIKTRLGFGAVAYRYPEAVVRLEIDGSSRVLHEVDDGVQLVTGGDVVWLVTTRPDGVRTVASLNPLTGAVHDLGPAGDVITIARGGVGVELVRPSPDPGVGGREDRWSARLVDVSSGRVRTVPIPAVVADDRYEVLVEGNTVWLPSARPPGLIGLAVDTATATLTSLDLDISTYRPAPTPRPGVDTATFEVQTADVLRQQLLEGWTDEHGHTTPYIDGVSVISVEPTGSFPTTRVEVRFTSVERPGVTFAASFALYDPLGNENDLEFGSVDLLEAVDAYAGLPALEHRQPDDDGLVWINVE